jgi:hypothetical protein
MAGRNSFEEIKRGLEELRKEKEMEEEYGKKELNPDEDLTWGGTEDNKESENE